MTTSHAGLLDVIGDCVLPARVLLGSTRMTVADLLSLHTGDIICLDQDQDAPLEIHISGRPKLLGQAQVQHGQITVTIEKTAPKETD